MSLAFDRVDGSVIGTISDGSAVVAIEARRARANGEIAIFQSGPWTFLLSASSDNPGVAPIGTGYGRITVSRLAVGTIIGSLPDGAKFSGSITLDRRSEATVFQSCYGGKGFIAGRLSFDGAPLLSGDLHWSHPALLKDKYFRTAFETDLSFKGSRFTAVPIGTRIVDFPDTANNAKLSAGQGSLTMPIVQVFTLDTKNTALVPSPNSEKLTLTVLSTGLFSGRFLDSASNEILKFNGAILQEQGFGAGFFLGIPVSGGVNLNSNPDPLTPRRPSPF